ncbi:hypothetical protein MLD38_039834 [Melastoma candidum]|uniref:Uncharacterized protein n=1 Tax=Melastoma candidum TaxID=119954 RepID=A0ACB9L5Q2_9MYRT|nr:hypothetical protein MLD38_039834 [Melastoma candidum]
MAEDLQYWIHDGNIWGTPANNQMLPRPCQAEAATLPVICDVDNWRVEDQLNDYSSGGGGLTFDPMSCFSLTGFDLLQSAQGTWHDQDFSQFSGRTIERSRSVIIQEVEEVNPKRYKLNQETTSAWSPNNFSESISPSKESTVDDEFDGDRDDQFTRVCLLFQACHGDSICVMDDDYLLRRVRMEASSPLPTFKVRKEKLGDRVTALQQLVSPFGKTDTASVLNEAVQYIELLHNQIRALSCPYMKHPDTHRKQPFGVRHKGGPRLNLRSRGLCLVPISSRIPVDGYEMAANPTWPAPVSETWN